MAVQGAHFLREDWCRLSLDELNIQCTGPTFYPLPLERQLSFSYLLLPFRLPET